LFPAHLRNGKSKPECTGTPFRGPKIVPLASHSRGHERSKIKPEVMFQGPNMYMFTVVPLDDLFLAVSTLFAVYTLYATMCGL